MYVKTFESFNASMGEVENFISKLKSLVDSFNKTRGVHYPVHMGLGPDGAHNGKKMECQAHNPEDCALFQKYLNDMGIINRKRMTQSYIAVDVPFKGNVEGV
jgi:hypothetical protein